MTHELVIKNLHLSAGDHAIVQGVSLTVRSGETHVIMGPNGSGKSTLLSGLMGHPSYVVTEGSILIDGQELTTLSPDKRAHAGLFLALQYPREIDGVTTGNFLRIAKNAMNKARGIEQVIAPAEFIPVAQQAISQVGLDSRFMGRFLNKGFSGGEKKRGEIAQMNILQPRFALLDEIDSGLDIDGLRGVMESIQAIQMRDNTGLIIVTHYAQIVELLQPTAVHIMSGGRIIQSGDVTLAQKINEQGYDALVSTT